MASPEVGLSAIARLASLCLALLVGSAGWVAAATYYVDSAGSDESDGTAPDLAWKTLARASKAVLRPGDQLLFKSGSRLVGQLVIEAKGTATSPVRVGRYGGKAPAVLAGEGKSDSTVEIRNCAHLVLEDLEITHELPDGKRRDNLYGVRLVASGGGEFEGVVLRRLHVHHVSGGWDRHGGAGIGCSAAGDDPKTGSKRSRFVGLRVEDCYIHDVSFYGLFVSGWANRFRDARWYPSRGVRVKDNLLHDIGGDAIVLIATENSAMEHNEAYRTSRGQQNGGQTPSGGIWPHSSDGAVVRFNKVAGIRGKMDCQPYDIDINCRNTTIENNLSQDNSGGFLLLCSITGEAGPTHDAVVRNNLSIGDGFESGRLITAVGLVSDVVVENNVFIGSTAAAVNILGGWESAEYPWCKRITLRRNVFFTEGKFTFDPGGMREIRMDGNAYQGRFAKPPEDPNRVQVELRRADLLPENLLKLDRPELRKAGFRAFDVSQCGLTKQSSWLGQRDKAAGRGDARHGG